MSTRKSSGKQAAAKKPVKKVVAAKKAAPAKKVVAKKVVAKKAAPKKATAKAKTPAVKQSLSIANALTKTQLFTTIAERTAESKKTVVAIFDSLTDIIAAHMKKRGPQIFTFPGLMKIKVINKPATKARKGINPFTGEETVFKAKPARSVVKVQALKKLKEMPE